MKLHQNRPPVLIQNVLTRCPVFILILQKNNISVIINLIVYILRKEIFEYEIETNCLLDDVCCIDAERLSRLSN